MGDIIVEADGKSVRKLSDLTDVLERIRVPGTVPLTVRRGGSERTLNVDMVTCSGRLERVNSWF